MLLKHQVFSHWFPHVSVIPSTVNGDTCKQACGVGGGNRLGAQRREPSLHAPAQCSRTDCVTLPAPRTYADGHCMHTQQVPSTCCWRLRGGPQNKRQPAFHISSGTFFQLLGIPDMAHTTAWTSGDTAFSVTLSTGRPPPRRQGGKSGPPHPPTRGTPCPSGPGPAVWRSDA